MLISFSRKYKKIKKKLCNQNITKTDAKGELAEIEQELEKKEEEITVVIGLYKEVCRLIYDFLVFMDFCIFVFLFWFCRNKDNILFEDFNHLFKILVVLTVVQTESLES